MPVILVATDFSATGNNAARYAAALAQSGGHELVLLHAWFMPVTFNDPAMPLMPLDDLGNAATERMYKAASELQGAFPAVNITTRIEYGDIEDTLDEALESVKPLLLVIGTHAGEEDTLWSDHTAADVLRNTGAPVLAVPSCYSYKTVRRVCIAVDARGLIGTVPVMMLRALLPEASLHILHVATAGEAETQPLITEQADIAYHQATADGSVDDCIAAFAAGKDIDWIAVIPHHHSFWASLFHKGHTEAMVRKSPVPVLAIHYPEN